jgi:hypothetical protein
MTQLAITYTAPGQKPHYVCLLDDEELLRRVAHLAMQQAEFRAAAVGSEDAIAGRLQRVEVQRLHDSLSILVPGFTAPSVAVAGVM